MRALLPMVTLQSGTAGRQTRRKCFNFSAWCRGRALHLGAQVGLMKTGSIAQIPVNCASFAKEDDSSQLQHAPTRSSNKTRHVINLGFAGWTATRAAAHASIDVLL